jgi:probable F420-dependent oxidoreductase
MRKIKFGVQIPTCAEGLMYPVPFASPADVLKIATSAEQFGFDSIWANDHITTQEYVRKGSPSPPNYYEAVVTLSIASQVTKKISLATGLIPLPLRNPVELAKQIATLDVFCGGRTILGVGIGAYKEEFTAMFPDMKKVHRGELADEALNALTRLFIERRVSFKGKHIRFADIELYPKPIQKPMPIYVGGNNPKGIERAARYGQGWFPASFTPREMTEKVSSLRCLAIENGRDPAEIDVAPQFAICIGKTREDAIDKYKRSQLYQHDISLKTSTMKGIDVDNLEERDLIGDEDQITKRIREYAEAGVTNFAGLIFVANTPAEMLGDMVLFADKIMPSFR